MDRVEGTLNFRRRRVSLTFRRIKRTPCVCKWPIFCDSRGFNQANFKFDEKDGVSVYTNNEEEQKMIQESIDVNDPSKPGILEKKYVAETYDKIAPHFSDTRYKPWPNVCNYLNDLPAQSVVVDVGCGNGKYFVVNPELMVFGTDVSRNLLKIAMEKPNISVAHADSLLLPFRDNCFDHLISIAVIHHFSNDALRKAAVEELVRIVRPGGTLLITVWAFEQPKKYDS